jgi:hypothetical protein
VFPSFLFPSFFPNEFSHLCLPLPFTPSVYSTPRI